MTAGILLALLFAGASVAFVVAPLLRRDASLPETAGGALDEERELQSRQQMLFAALKDLEDDRATAKIGESDYEALKARLSSQAIEIMQRLDVLAAEREQAERKARDAARPLRYPGKKRPDRSR